MNSTYLSFRLYTQDLSKSLARTASQTQVARDIQYYRDNIGKVTSVDQFLKDNRLFTVAMKAAGLDDLITAKAFMRKVLESNLSDPKSFANQLADTRYATFAKSFNFTTTGGVTESLTYAQNDIQADDTIELYSEHRIKQGVATATEAKYYQATIPTVTTADQLIANKRLFAFALNSVGLDPDRASAAFIRNVLTSDLSDPGSMANQLADTRYRNLAAAFSFDEDGNAPPGGAAQTAAQLDQTVFENYTQGGPSPAGAAYNSTYYANTVPTLGTVDDFLGNDRLFDYALTAYGINPNTASKVIMREVLVSDLSDPGSFANSIADTKYRTLAAAFNFQPDGRVSPTDGAQTAEQIGVTKTRYLSLYDDAAVASEASKSSIYRARINVTTSVDALLADSTLYTYTLQAFGLDADTESKSQIKRVLTSDSADPRSFANTQSDPRYRALAAAFNFGPDGHALQPRKAQTDNDELATIRAYTAKTGTSASETAAAKEEGVYYHNTITMVRSLDDFLADKRLVAYVTKAFGLEGSKLSNDTLRKALTSDTADANSFINKPGQDQRLRDLAAAFNFTADGKLKRVPAQAAQSQSNAVAATTSFVRQTMEKDAGQQNEGVRLALYFQRMASTISSPLGILADKALLKVVQTALGFPTAMSQASIESQVAMIKKRLDVADFQDPAKVEKFLARFAAMYDVDNGSTAVSSPALAILGGGSTTVGTDTGLLASLQRLGR